MRDTLGRKMSNLHNEELWEQLYNEAMEELEPYYITDDGNIDEYEKLQQAAAELAHGWFYR